MEKQEERAEEGGKGNNSEVDHAFCLEARLRTSKIVLRPIFLLLCSLHSLFLSSGSLLSSILGRSFSPSSLLAFSLSLFSSLLFSFSFSHIYSLFLSALALFPSPYLFPSETSRCVRTNTSEKSFTLTNTNASLTSRIRPRLSFSVSHSPSLFHSPLFSLSLLSSSSLI